MERRLKVVQNNITTKEERAAKEKNKFQNEKRKCVLLLKQVYEDLSERNNIKRANGNYKKAAMLNAKCRINLKDADELVKSLVSDYKITRKVGGKNPVENQKVIINAKFKASQHCQEMYDICNAMFLDSPLNKGDSARANLLEGIEEDNSFFRHSPRIEPIENTNPLQSSGGVMVVGPGQMEAQWLSLLEESDQEEAKYLRIIEENVLSLNEMAIAIGIELDRQNIMIDEAGGKMDRNQKKLDVLTPKVEQALEQKKTNNRCLYLVLFVVLVSVLAFVLIKFVFQDK